MDNKTIQAKVQEFKEKVITELTADGVLDDFIGLYGDIRIELSQKAPEDETPRIDKYAAFMAREQQIFSPELAYQNGFEAAQSGLECNPMEYLSSVYSSSENQCFFNERNNLFNELCCLLGDTRGLIIEYTEIYQQLYGTINEKIHQFYEWGYYGKIPDATESAG